MIRSKENEKYIKTAFTGFAVLVAGMICFFLIYRIKGFGDFFDMLITILMPFIIGFAIAFVLKPTCRWWEAYFVRMLTRMHVKHVEKTALVLSVILCELMAVFVTVTLMMLVIPKLMSSLLSLSTTLPDQLDGVNLWLHSMLEQHPIIQDYWDNIYAEIALQLKEWLKSDLSPTISLILGSLGDQVVNVIELLKNVFLGFIVSVYLLAGRKKFRHQIKLMLYGMVKKKWADLIRAELLYADKMFSGFLMGKLLDSAIIGIICFIVTYLMGIQSALLISVVIGVTNIIPFFGPFIGAVPCALWLLIESPVHCISFIIFIIILQQIDGNIIGPKILGNSTGLSSFWVLFSIILFGGLWGFVGMIIAVPLFAVIYDVVKKLVYRGLRMNHYEEGMKQCDETLSDV